MTNLPITFNTKIMRFRYTKEFIDSLCTYHTSLSNPHFNKNAVESWEYNPIYFYPKGVKLIDGELGCDARYRYIETYD